MAALCLVLAATSWTSPTLQVSALGGGPEWCFDVGGIDAPASVMNLEEPHIERSLVLQTVTCSWPVTGSDYDYTVTTDYSSTATTVATLVFLLSGVAIWVSSRRERKTLRS